MDWVGVTAQPEEFDALVMLAGMLCCSGSCIVKFNLSLFYICEECDVQFGMGWTMCSCTALSDRPRVKCLSVTCGGRGYVWYCWSPARRDELLEWTVCQELWFELFALCHEMLSWLAWLKIFGMCNFRGRYSGLYRSCVYCVCVCACVRVCMHACVCM